MANMQFSDIENSLSNYDFDGLAAQNETAKATVAGASSADDVKTAICNIWSKVRSYVIWAENIPVIGKFVTILADLLDSICGTGSASGGN
jgi:hypothetical protein